MYSRYQNFNCCKILGLLVLDSHSTITLYQPLTGSDVIKLLYAKTQPGMKFILLINVKMTTIYVVVILTLISRIHDKI